MDTHGARGLPLEPRVRGSIDLKGLSRSPGRACAPALVLERLVLDPRRVEDLVCAVHEVGAPAADTSLGARARDRLAVETDRRLLLSLERHALASSEHMRDEEPSIIVLVGLGKPHLVRESGHQTRARAQVPRLLS